MQFLCLSDLIATHQLSQKRVFIRADLNVPLDVQGHITDDTRLRASLPAICQSLAAGAAVMVTSHLGRPTEGHLTDADSLAPIARRLSELLEQPVPLQKNWLSGVDVSPGQIVLLENCRGHQGESSNDSGLAKTIAGLCDVYINDAFGTAHRAEATTVGIAEYAPIVAAGPLMVAELAALSRAFHSPKRPLIAIVGGSKVSTKLTILRSLAARVDQLIVGGGIANTFLLAKGIAIGQSLAEPALLHQAREVIALMEKRHAAVPLPVDVVCATMRCETAHARVRTFAARSTEVLADNDMILDIGPQTVAQWVQALSQAGTIIWNGPVGAFEYAPFGDGTRELALAIAASDAFSVAGGGDTLVAIAKYGIADKIDYISTGGGAFLAFLEGSPLPALQILIKRSGLSV